MNTPPPSALRIDSVSKSFGSLAALKKVNIDIKQGEFFGLLGPNGAGKSTLISIVAGLTRMDSGAVSVMGHDSVRDFRNARRKLGVVPQELVFDPFFKVHEVLRIQAGYYGCGAEALPWIEEMLERLELKDKRNTTMRSLSGGMKRRVLIAQALVHKPPVVILDEPTAGVDVELRRTLWAFMRDLHANGTTVVLTTHYLEEAQEMCERIAILDHGEIQALESTPALLARQPFRFLKVRLPENSVLPDHLQSLVSSEENHFIELKLNTSTHPVGKVLDMLRSAGIAVEDVHTRDPDLEDIFVELTQ